MFGRPAPPPPAAPAAPFKPNPTAVAFNPTAKAFVPGFSAPVPPPSKPTTTSVASSDDAEPDTEPVRYLSTDEECASLRDQTDAGARNAQLDCDQIQN
jgi:hypothetical protein